MAITAKSKLYARMVKNGQREYPDGIPTNVVSVYDVWDAYTNFYHYTPELTPPNEGEGEESP